MKGPIDGENTEEVLRGLVKRGGSTNDIVGFGSLREDGVLPNERAEFTPNAVDEDASKADDESEDRAQKAKDEEREAINASLAAEPRNGRDDRRPCADVPA